MKYLSIDLETTGLDPQNHEILTFSAILEDTEKKLPFDPLVEYTRKNKGFRPSLLDAQETIDMGLADFLVGKNIYNMGHTGIDWQRSSLT